MQAREQTHKAALVHTSKKAVIVHNVGSAILAGRVSVSALRKVRCMFLRSSLHAVKSLRQTKTTLVAPGMAIADFPQLIVSLTVATVFDLSLEADPAVITGLLWWDMRRMRQPTADLEGHYMHRAGGHKSGQSAVITFRYPNVAHPHGVSAGVTIATGFAKSNLTVINRVLNVSHTSQTLAVMKSGFPSDQAGTLKKLHVIVVLDGAELSNFLFSRYVDKQIVRFTHRNDLVCCYHEEGLTRTESVNPLTPHLRCIKATLDSFPAVPAGLLDALEDAQWCSDHSAALTYYSCIQATEKLVEECCAADTVMAVRSILLESGLLTATSSSSDRVQWGQVRVFIFGERHGANLPRFFDFFGALPSVLRPLQLSCGTTLQGAPVLQLMWVAFFVLQTLRLAPPDRMSMIAGDVLAQARLFDSLGEIIQSSFVSCYPDLDAAAVDWIPGAHNHCCHLGDYHKVCRLSHSRSEGDEHNNFLDRHYWTNYTTRLRRHWGNCNGLEAILRNRHALTRWDLFYP